MITTTYKTSDGVEYKTIEAAKKHESKLEKAKKIVAYDYTGHRVYAGKSDARFIVLRDDEEVNAYDKACEWLHARRAGITSPGVYIVNRYTSQYKLPNELFEVIRNSNLWDIDVDDIGSM